MSIQSLTAKYRPQTFAQVAGQDAVKTILSRAAAEDRVAPAYLFSGTRGVGKTTIARIFAKALNCVHAPAPEPCNECSRCRQATVGAFIDVVEIDGASHGRVDDARALKETVGFAPQEGRYKVIIIDEAHMLSTAAFNALLKTLEEPPPRVTFIMATTEVRKFPATIVSRCQHYVFQMLSQDALAAHLENILRQEGIDYEPGAVQIVAKRGAGSVRDSMSLLGQALALGEGVLHEEAVRSFLGLAGQEVFFALMAGIHAGDVVAVGRVLRGILDQGLDLGFFLRELTACWRNMFLLRQAGERATELLSMSGDEASAWHEWARKFSPTQIHASWQMTLEGQRRVMTSLEPALALELLLLNLACLPDLLGLDRLPAPAAGASGGAAPAAAVPPAPSVPSAPSSPSGSSGSPSASRPGAVSGGASGAASGSMPGASPSAPHRPAPFAPPPPPPPVPSPPAAASEASTVPPTPAREPEPAYEPAHEPAYAPEPAYEPAYEPEYEPEYDQEADFGPEFGPAHGPDNAQDNGPGPASFSSPSPAPGGRTVDGFRQYVADLNGSAGAVFNLHGLDMALEGRELVIPCPNTFVCGQFEGEGRRHFFKLVTDYFGSDWSFRVVAGGGTGRKPEHLLREEAENHPAVQAVQAMFDARVQSVARRRE